jgi:hypothetical protein
MTSYPYTSGWPLWPFTRLSPKEMAKLLKAIEGKRVSEAEEALL